MYDIIVGEDKTVVCVCSSACHCLVFESFGQSQGSFRSVNFPAVYPPAVNCVLYTFIGDLGEIVEAEFVDFDLQRPTSRSHKYVDVRPDVCEQFGFNSCCLDVTSGKNLERKTIAVT